MGYCSVGGKGTAYTAKNASKARTVLFHANAMRRLPMLKRIDPEGTMSLRAVAAALNGMAIPTVSSKGQWSANSVRRLRAVAKHNHI